MAPNEIYAAGDAASAASKRREKIVVWAWFIVSGLIYGGGVTALILTARGGW